MSYIGFYVILLRKESKKLFLWNHTIGYKMQNERICIKKSFFSSSTSKGTKFCIILYIPLYCLWNWLILFSTHEEISVFWRSAHDTRLNWNWTKKRKNDFLYIFVFAQYFSNALFWVPHIAEIKKSIFYEFDFICMKNAISHIFFQIAPWKNEWLFGKNIMTYTLVEIWNVLFYAIGWGMKKMIKTLVFICTILGGTFFDIFIYLWGNVEKNDFQVSKKVFILLW